MAAAKEIQKGEILIEEGSNSTSMYWLQSGRMRLYKRKGGGFVELGNASAGELLGEMSFLDKQPRSASVSALIKSEVVEIPRGKFQEIMQTQPKWLNSLITILVKRLRNANNRLREIEDASMSYIKDQSGSTQRHYEFITVNVLLRMCTCLLLAGTCYGEHMEDQTIKVDTSLLNMYGSGIMGIPEVKVSIFIEVLSQASILKIEKTDDKTFLYIKSINFIKTFINWLYKESIEIEEKRTNFTKKGIDICNLIHQYGDLDQYEDEETVSIDLNALQENAEKNSRNRLSLDFSAVEELVKAGLTSELRVSDTSKKVIDLKLNKFQAIYPYLSLRQQFIDVNKEKSI